MRPKVKRFSPREVTLRSTYLRFQNRVRLSDIRRPEDEDDDLDDVGRPQQHVDFSAIAASASGSTSSTTPAIATIIDQFKASTRRAEQSKLRGAFQPLSWKKIKYVGNLRFGAQNVF